MSIVINARGTSVPFFKIGKTGVTIYQGSSDPSTTYSPVNGDLWINSNNNSIQVWGSAAWQSQQLGTLNFSGSTVSSAIGTNLTLQTPSSQSVIFSAGSANPVLTSPTGTSLTLHAPSGGNLTLNANTWPLTDGTAGQILTTTGAGTLSWSTVTGVGTVTSVSLADTSITPIFAISGTPITSSGTIDITLENQVAGATLMAPASNAGQPSFRAIAYTDLPIKLYTESPSSPATSSCTGVNSVVVGDGARAALYGSKAWANGKFTNMGDAQRGMYILRNQTTTAAVTELFLDGASQELVIPNNCVMSFSIVVAARRTDVTGGAAGYKFDGVIVKDITAGSVSFIGSPSKTVLGETNVVWDAALSTNTSTGAIKVLVTGEAFKTIRWVATVLTTEVTN